MKKRACVKNVSADLEAFFLLAAWRAVYERFLFKNDGCDRDREGGPC